MSEAVVQIIRAFWESDPKSAATFPWWDRPEKMPFHKVVNDLISAAQGISGRRDRVTEDEDHDLPEMFDRHETLLPPEKSDARSATDGIAQHFKPYLHAEAKEVTESIHRSVNEIYDILGYITLGLVLANKMPPERALEKLEFWCQEIRKAADAPSSESSG